ncbi:uncharacterized protein [Coffea arabica]|uniref:DUF4283 domain-containing protein n=1 Tax=Coffea arabica TaxID=13443 RepID=A0ABM4W8F3_COFAR
MCCGGVVVGDGHSWLRLQSEAPGGDEARTLPLALFLSRFALKLPSMEVIRRFFVTLGLKGSCSVGLLDSKHVLLQPEVEEDYTRPQQVDAATLSIKRPSVARLLIEVDVAKPPLPRLWLGDEEYGQWQKVEFEGWPSFCGHCERIGHGEQECFRLHPERKPARVKPGVPSQVFLPKAQQGQGPSPAAPFEQRALLLEKPGQHESPGQCAAVSPLGSGGQWEEQAWEALAQPSGSCHTRLARLEVVLPIKDAPTVGNSADYVEDIPVAHEDDVALANSFEALGGMEEGIELNGSDEKSSAQEDEVAPANPFAALGDKEEGLELKSPRTPKGRSLSVGTSPLLPPQARPLRCLNLLVCNIWGVSRKDSRRYLHKLCVDNLVKLLVLIEPMTDAVQLPVICRKPHFPKTCSVLEGKMWVLWKDDMVAQVQEIGDQLVNIKTGLGGYTLLFSAIYAKCTGLAEVSFVGSPFTWTNGVLWHRLDRVLTNAGWSDLFVTTTVSHLVHGRSDHAPLLIRSGDSERRPSSFRYLNVLKRHPGFLEVIQQA